MLVSSQTFDQVGHWLPHSIRSQAELAGDCSIEAGILLIVCGREMVDFLPTVVVIRWAAGY